MGKIVALGGGVFMGKKEDRFPPKMKPIHEEIIRLTGKRRPRILYIPTAADDSVKRIKGFRKYYTGLGCEVDVLCLLKRKGRPSQMEIKSKIESADAVFVTGGNTHRTIATWKRHGVDRLLKQAYRQGKVMSGYSAGAICWFAYGNSDSFSKERIFRVTAMGIINALICPHYDSEPHRQPVLKKMMRRTYGMVAIALDEYAVIEIIDGKYRILTAQPSAQARRIYWKMDEYVIQAIKPDTKFRDLKGLLTL
ncbi:MAG TPA: peptidase E [Candidatus Saccharimonadales bacterium]|nr:peptidase E [Candidatus Saccharimonadales bacterium]